MPKPKRQVRDLNRIMARCRWHKPKELGYVGWSIHAQTKVKQGHVQKKCPDCGRLLFKDEWGTPPRGRAWRSL